MRKRLAILTLSLLVVAMAVPCFAGSARILSDEELDQVSAKGLPEVIYSIEYLTDCELASQLAGMNGTGFNLNNGYTLFNMNGQAQQDLQSLTNVTAVNSAVAVLVNFTVNFGDNVTVNQTNTATLANHVI